jgi:hypothetical protein
MFVLKTDFGFQLKIMESSIEDHGGDVENPRALKHDYKTPPTVIYSS